MKAVGLIILAVLNVLPAIGCDQLPLAEWVPERFEKARQVPVAIDGNIAPAWLGQYHLEDKKIILAPYRNKSTLAHEVGHAVWDLDLNRWQKLKWAQIHRENPSMVAVRRYKYDNSHSFAAAFSMFVTAPEFLELDSLAAYFFMRTISGGAVLCK